MTDKVFLDPRDKSGEAKETGSLGPKDFEKEQCSTGDKILNEEEQAEKGRVRAIMRSAAMPVARPSWTSEKRCTA